MFSPKDIRETVFEQTARGYNTEDVDSFLAQMATQVEELVLRRDELEKKLAEATAQMSIYEQDGDALRSALVTAEKIKAQTIASAKEESDKLIADAKAEAEKIVADAQFKSDTIVGAISSKVDVEEATLRALKKQVDDFKNNVLGIYKEHLESLAKLPEYDGEAEEPKAEENAAEEPIAEPVPELEPAAEPEEPKAEEPAEQLPVFEQPELEAPVFEEPAAEPAKEESADTFGFNPSFGDEPEKAEEEPAKDNFSFDSGFAERFGKLDFGDNFSFGSD